MNTRKKAAFAVFTVVCVFAAAELLLWASGFAVQSAAPSLRFHVDEMQSAGYDADPRVFWQLKAGFEGIVSDNHPWEVRVNSRRMRGPEFRVPKPPGTFRILSLGDSSAFGWGVAEDRTYARVLEHLLNERQVGSGRLFEVLNAGVPGYSSFQGLGYLERDLLDLDADVVLTYFGLNDLTGARFYSDREQSVQTTSAAIALLARSRIYQALWKLLRPTSGSERFDSYFRATDHFRVSPEEYRANLLEIQRLVESRLGRALFIRPTWRSPQDDRLYAQAFWLSEPIDLLAGLAPVVDAYAALKAREDEADRLFLDVAHPTEIGHRLIARVIYQSLVTQGIVADPPERHDSAAP